MSNTCVWQEADWLAGAKKKNNQRLVATFRPQTVDTGRSTWAIRKTAARNQIDKKQAPHTHTYMHTAGGRQGFGGVAVCGCSPRTRLDSTRCEWRNVRRAFILKFDVVVVANKH